tara:strand:+ start:13922 stop:15022 length:1101 start_codon:yes stop_codon:yes gene_type:complete
MFNFRHHNSAFSISTSCIKNRSLKRKVDCAIKDVFRGFLLSDKEEVVIEFIFTDEIDNFITDDQCLRVKDIKVGNLQTHFKDNELEFLVNNENIFKVYFNVSNNECFKSSLRFFNKSFKNNIEQQITTFYYRIFLLFSQLWNIQNDLSYLHSSSFEISGESIVFTADSGVGKSSLLFRLSEDKSVSFIADDLTILSSESEVFYQGRSLSVKPYHLRYFSFLKDKLKKIMHRGQNFQWKLLNDNRLTYRIAPDHLFDNIATKSKIKRVIHLCNHSERDFKISDISCKDLVKFTNSILINELYLANSKLNAAASLPNSPFICSSELYNKVSQIYLKAFDNIEIILVLVPFMSDPNELYRFLKKEGCLD